MLRDDSYNDYQINFLKSTLYKETVKLGTDIIIYCYSVF